MKIPTEVKVGPFRYPVRFYRRIQARPDCNPSEPLTDLWGQFANMESEIRIAEHAGHMARWNTFFHEVLHAMSENMHDPLREDQVTVLAPILLAFLLDNGFLVLDDLTDEEETYRRVAVAAMLAPGMPNETVLE